MRWIFLVLLLPSFVYADAFDRYTLPDLVKAVAAAQPAASVTAGELAAAGAKLPGTPATLVLVRTRDDRLAKLLVQPGLQKVGQARHPMLLIDRYVTFKPGEERVVVVKGAGVQVFPGLEFSLDLGQVVPASVGGDFAVSVVDGKLTVKPGTGAKLFLMSAPPTPSAPAKGGKPEVGDAFEPRFFNGTFKLHDDGRRSGTLNLDVDESSGEVTGSFYSDKDGRKYDVKGKLGTARHAIQFTIKYPQIEQQFAGHLFTADARAIAGTAKLQDRETGFYAVRVEE